MLFSLVHVQVLSSLVIPCEAFIGGGHLFLPRKLSVCCFHWQLCCVHWDFFVLFSLGVAMCILLGDC